MKEINSAILLILSLLFLTGCGGGSANITITPPTTSSPDILLYSSNPNAYNELLRLENGTQQVLLSNPAYDYWWAKVAPNKSSFLVYRSPANTMKNHDDYNNVDLMLFDMDGNNPRTLISKGQYGWSAQGVSRWNKNGTKILMAAEQSFNGSKQWRLVITDAQGGNPKNLSDWWIIDPNFSPDNQFIVFMAFPDNALAFDLSKLELHRANYSSTNDTLSNIVRLTNNNTRDHDPSYSPDGTKIVFSAGNESYSDVDIVVYDVNTGLESTLVNDSASNGGSMVWSNNGESIYFHSLNLSAHSFRIKQIDVSSQTLREILQSSTNNFGYYHPEVY